MTATIDAHQHFWDLAGPFDFRWLDAPQHAPIRRNFLPTDLKPHLDSCGVQYSVFVQTQHDLAENHWALGLADANPFILGVVGWIDLASPDCERQLLEMRRHRKFVGVRHITQDEPDDDFIVRPEVLRGLTVLEKHSVPFDLLFYEKHLKHAATVARACPELPLVIDHLSKPRIRVGSMEAWLPHLKAAAQCPNVSCKLSGLADWGKWTVEDLRPYVRAALELFGPQRCMFASDWPVCELAGSYERVHAAIVDAIGPLSEGEREAVFGGTARRFYGLTMPG
jgi:L-fuconolactonase